MQARSLSARISGLFLLLGFVLSIQAGSDLLERELFTESPMALSHIFFLDSLNTDFNPLSSQRVGYSFFQSNWMEYAAFKFEQALFQSRSYEERDWLSFWFGLSYLRYAPIEDMYEEVARFDTPWANLWRGLALFEMEELDSARRVLSDVVEMDDIQQVIRLEGKYILGLSYIEDQPRRAETIFEEILNEYPKSILTGEILFRLAVVELESDSIFRAMDRLTECEVYYLSSPRKDAHWWAEDMYILLGSINYRLGRYSVARKRLTDMLDRFPESDYEMRARHLMLLSGLREFGISDSTFRIPQDMDQRLKWDLLFNLAWEHFINGNYNQAVDIFQMTLRYAEEPIDKIQSHYYLAESFYAQENYEYAREYFQLAARNESPIRRESQWGLAWSHSRLKEYDQSRQAFQLASEGDDTLAIRAKYQTAMTFYNQRQFSIAIDSLEAFSRYHRGWLLDDAQYFIVKALERMDIPERLADRTEAFVRDFPYTRLSEQFVVSSVKRLLAVGEWDRAVNLSDILQEREVEIFKRDSIIHYGNIARLRRGDYSNMQSYLDNYEPDNHLLVSVVAEVADSLTESGEFDQAVLIWEQLKDPDIPDSLFAYSTYKQAHCLFALGDISGVKRNIDQIVGELPDSEFGPMGLVDISKWYIENMDFDSAIDNIERTRKLFPETVYDYQSMILLAEIYMNIEKYPEARSMLTSVPHDSLNQQYWEQAQIDIMESYILEGAYNRAVDFHDEIDLNPENQCIFDGQLGHVHSLLGNVTTADSIFTDITEKRERCGHKIPGHIYFIWGDLMERAREYDKACSLLTIVIREEDSDSIVRKAREKIFEIENELKGGKE